MIYVRVTCDDKVRNVPCHNRLGEGQGHQLSWLAMENKTSFGL